MSCDDLEGWEELRVEGGNICIYTADSLHCTTDTQHCKASIFQ